jgi:DNA ligase (NAD+)
LILERFAEKSADNFIEAMNSKRKVDLSRFIYALGIRHVGQESAEALSDYIYPLIKGKTKNNQLDFNDFIEVILSLEAEKLKDIEDFGPIVSKSIYAFFRDEHNLKILKKLIEVDIKLLLKNSNINNLNKNKNFLLTGTLNSLTREAAKAKIKELGGKVLPSVSKKLDFLIVGDNPGGKLDKARSLDVKVLSEKEFLGLINFYGNK